MIALRTNSLIKLRCQNASEGMQIGRARPYLHTPGENSIYSSSSKLLEEKKINAFLLIFNLYSSCNMLVEFNKFQKP